MGPNTVAMRRRAGISRIGALFARRHLFQAQIVELLICMQPLQSSVVKTLFALLVATTFVAAQAPQVGLIAPLPPPAPASTFDASEKTILELLAAQRIGTVTSHDLVEKYLARIKAYDHEGPGLNAMIA